MSEGAVKLVDGLDMSALSRGSGVHLSSKGMYEEDMVGLDGEECTLLEVQEMRDDFVDGKKFFF